MSGTAPAHRPITFAVLTDDGHLSREVLQFLNTLAQNPKNRIAVVELSSTAQVLQPEHVPVFFHAHRFTREGANGVRKYRKESKLLRVGSVVTVFDDMQLAVPPMYTEAPACIAIRRMDCSTCSHTDFSALREALRSAVHCAKSIVDSRRRSIDSKLPSKRKQRAAEFKNRTGRYAQTISA